MYSALRHTLAFMLVINGALSAATAAIGAPNIVGKWTATAPDGVKITYHFKSDGTVFWAGEHPSQGSFIMSGKYVVDFTAKPNQIDMFDFSDPRYAGFMCFGIVEFRDDKRMLLEGTPSRGGKRRPAKFGPDSLEFRKLE